MQTDRNSLCRPWYLFTHLGSPRGYIARNAIHCTTIRLHEFKKKRHCQETRGTKKKIKKTSRKPHVILHHRKPLVLKPRAAAPRAIRATSPLAAREATPALVGTAASLSVAEAAAAAIRKAASVAVGEEAPATAGEAAPIFRAGSEAAASPGA